MSEGGRAHAAGREWDAGTEASRGARGPVWDGGLVSGRPQRSMPAAPRDGPAGWGEGRGGGLGQEGTSGRLRRCGATAETTTLYNVKMYLFKLKIKVI